MTIEPNAITIQEMTQLLDILSGKNSAIINPEKLMDGGTVYDKIDIYNLAAALVGLRKLIEGHGTMVAKIVEKITEDLQSIDQRLSVLELPEDLGRE